MSLLGLAVLVPGLMLVGPGLTSVRTQEHGSAGTVLVLRVVEPAPLRAWGSTVDVDGELLGPPGATRAVVVRVPATSTVHRGQSLRVLVDPENAGHVELPGRSTVRTWQWLTVMLVGALAGMAYPVARVAERCPRPTRAVGVEG